MVWSVIGAVSAAFAAIFGFLSLKLIRKSFRRWIKVTISETQGLITIEGTNKGFRTTTITGAAAEVKGKKHIPFGTFDHAKPPYVLAETARCAFHQFAEDVAKNLKAQGLSNVVKLFGFQDDTLGKRWYSSEPIDFDIEKYLKKP